MAGNQSIKVSGLKELGACMKELGKETALKISRAMTNEAAQLVKFVAVDLAPQSAEAHTSSIDGGAPTFVQPGNLKRNIIVKRNGRTRLTSEHLVLVRGKRKDGYAARYGRLVEFGTVKMAPQPFLRPALGNNVPAATNAMKVKGEKMIQAAAKRIAGRHRRQGS